MAPQPARNLVHLSLLVVPRVFPLSLLRAGLDVLGRA